MKKTYRGYLIDLDGTMYRGGEVVAEAPFFIEWLKEQDIPYLFLTNNSSLTPEQVAKKLTAMGISCQAENVYTTGMGAAAFIQNEKIGENVYVIGEQGLIRILEEAGCLITEANPDCVVIGIDRDITYQKLATASLAIQNGATFISTNSDRAIPTERGLVPGNGALTAAVATACGVEPIFVGKPEALFVQLALEKLNLKPEEVLLVGDNLHTDILAGIRAGVDTLLVYTGITKPGDEDKEQIHPTYAVSHLKEWIHRS